MRNLKKYIAVLVFGLVLASGCQKDWDSHNAVTDEALTKTLLEHVQANASLSKFAELLVKTGYDKVIASSKTFTVFAPTNDALAGLDPAIVADTAKLNRFVANHIANQSYFTTQALDTLRIVMLNGKYNNMQGKKVETAAITSADQYARNGVLHVVDQMLPALSNCWEVLNSSDFPAAQRDFLYSLNYDGFDPKTAEQIGVDPLTGEPIYKPGTGVVPRNLYWDRVYDLRDEARQFTFFALNDAAYDTERNVFKPYFVTGSADSTNNLAAFSMLRDFAVQGLIAQDQLPDTLYSKFGTKVPIDKSAITKVIKTSNGIVYVMNKLSVAPKDKFKSLVIQAESYTSTSVDRRGNTYFRDKFNTTTGQDFRDVLVLNHGVALFNIRYALAEMPSLKYKAYWVAFNDFQTTNYTQKLGIGTATSTVLPYITVTPLNYNEVLLGEFTLSAYQPRFDVYLTAANSTSNAANPLVCDYIRLEPVF